MWDEYIWQAAQNLVQPFHYHPKKVERERERVVPSVGVGSKGNGSVTNGSSTNNNIYSCCTKVGATSLPSH